MGEEDKISQDFPYGEHVPEKESEIPEKEKLEDVSISDNIIDEGLDPKFLDRIWPIRSAMQALPKEHIRREHKLRHGFDPLVGMKPLSSVEFGKLIEATKFGRSFETRYCNLRDSETHYCAQVGEIKGMDAWILYDQQSNAIRIGFKTETTDTHDARRRRIEWCDYRGDMFEPVIRI